MTQYLGRISLLLALGAWIAYFTFLIVGGIDPSPALSRILQIAVMATLAAVLLSLLLALVALARGPQRISAAIAFGLCVVFGLFFSGLFFAMLP
jgi:hypothetical protein